MYAVEISEILLIIMQISVYFRKYLEAGSHSMSRDEPSIAVLAIWTLVPGGSSTTRKTLTTFSGRSQIVHLSCVQLVQATSHWQCVFCSPAILFAGDFVASEVLQILHSRSNQIPHLVEVCGLQSFLCGTCRIGLQISCRSKPGSAQAR